MLLENGVDSIAPRRRRRALWLMPCKQLQLHADNFFCYVLYCYNAGYSVFMPSQSEIRSQRQPTCYVFSTMMLRFMRNDVRYTCYISTAKIVSVCQYGFAAAGEHVGRGSNVASRAKELDATPGVDICFLPTSELRPNSGIVKAAEFHSGLS